jgi:ketosteroid isomerase-like protein
MSQENVEIVRQGIDHFNATGEPLWEVLDPNVEWWDREDDMDATVHRGHDGFSKRLAELDELAELHMEAKEFIDAGDYVVVPVRLHGRGRASDALFEEHEVHVYKLRDGKEVELREYRDRAEALKAVGLSEKDAHADS